MNGERAGEEGGGGWGRREQTALTFVRSAGRIRSSRKIDIRKTTAAFDFHYPLPSLYDLRTYSTRIKERCKFEAKNQFEDKGKNSFLLQIRFLFFHEKAIFLYVLFFIPTLTEILGITYSSRRLEIETRVFISDFSLYISYHNREVWL